MDNGTDLSITSASSLGLKIKVSENVGRFLEAERDFQGKEIIFEETPIVIAPSGQLDYEPESGAFYCVCSGCFLSLKDVDEDQVYDCPACGWPFCCMECANADVYHKKMECSIFKKQEISQDPETIRAVYFIRCLCLSKQDNGNADHRWMKLQDLTANYKGDAQLNSCTEKDTVMHRFLSMECGMSVKPETVATLNGVRNINAFQVNFCEFGERKYYGMALYYLSSIAAHSCHPNIRWHTITPDEKPGFPMRFQASRPISSGESVTIAYRNKCLTNGTLSRRADILSGHGFVCRCDRCEDVTEFDTNFSAIRCAKCDLGYLLPETASDPASDWVCRNCKQVETVSYVRSILDRISGQIQRAKSSEKSKLIDVCDKLDAIINNYSRRVLHPNNYLLLWAQFLWLQFMEHDLHVKKCCSIPHEKFILIQLRAKQCNEIYSKFLSTCSKFYGYFERLRGTTMYIYYLNPEVWNKLDDLNRLKVLRKALEHFQRSLNYDGWSTTELEFIEIKIRNVKQIVQQILHSRCTTL